MHNDSLSDDVLRGAAAISEYEGDQNLRQTYYKLEKGILPAFKEGSRWAMRKSTRLRQIQDRESEAVAKARAK